jgi:hypothetical protein
MGASASCLEPDATSVLYDFYDGLAVLLRICDGVSRQPTSSLAAWLPRAQGYLQVALKHLPEIGGADYAQHGLAEQWRAANLLGCAAPISARWLQQQLRVECGILTAHPGFHFLREVSPEEMAAVIFCAWRRVGRAGLFWA